MVFHNQVQTFVQNMAGGIVIAHSHITHITSPPAAETNSSTHDKGEKSLSWASSNFMRLTDTSTENAEH